MLLRAGDSFRATAPILRREFVALLRTRRAFWMAVLTVAGASLIPLLHWPRPGQPMADQNAREAFWTWNAVFHAALLLFVPAVAGTSLPQERERGTFELLLAAPISPGALLLGKLLASTGFFLLLVLLTFPVAALLYLLGGFEAWELGAALVLLLFSALFLGFLGVFSSVGSRKSLHGIAATYGCFLVSLGGFLYLGVVAGISVIAALVLAGFFLVFTVPLARSHIAGMILELPPAEMQPHPLPDGRPFPRKFPSWRKEGIPDRWNPIVAAAMVSGLIGGWELFAIAFAVLGFFPVLVTANPEAGSTGWLIIRMGAYHLGCLVFFLTIAAASSLQLERQPWRLDLLRSTLLHPRDILRGKLQLALLRGGIIVSVSLMGLALPLPAAVAGAPKAESLLLLLLLVPAVPVTALYAASAGLLGGALGTTLPRALAISCAVAWGPLLASLSVLGREHPLPACLSPVVACLRLPAGAPAGGQLPEALVAYVISLVIGALLAWLQYWLALMVMETRWMRDR